MSIGVGGVVMAGVHIPECNEQCDEEGHWLIGDEAVRETLPVFTSENPADQHPRQGAGTAPAPSLPSVADLARAMVDTDPDNIEMLADGETFGESVYRDMLPRAQAVWEYLARGAKVP